jgi:hypothetical protein
MRTAFFFGMVCTLLLFSCSKSESNSMDQAGLPGTWTLVETLADPGDGSGTWQPATAPLALTFTANGTIEGNAFPQARRYQVLSTTTIKFIYADDTFIIYNYALTESVLSLSGGGCIEACGLKFIKRRSGH